jgi:hypothetical protein
MPGGDSHASLECVIAEHYTIATLWAQSRLAAVGIETPLEAGETQGRLPAPYRWRSRVTPIVDESESAGPPKRTQLFEVVLTVEWGTGSDARSVSLTTHRLAKISQDDSRDLEVDR